MISQNRRHFIKTMAASAAGVTLLNFFDLNASTLDSAAGQSLGGLASYAVLDDCARIAANSNLIDERVAGLVLADMNDNIPANLSRFGAMVQVDKAIVETSFERHSQELRSLETAEQTEETADRLDTTQRKLALLLGWYMAAGVREVLAPLYEPQPAFADRQPSEMSIYHDMEVLRQIAGTPQRSSVSTAEIESLFNGMLPRLIGRTHTLTPDYDDGMNWTVRVSHWRDDTMQLMQEYADAYVKPHPEKVQRFISDINFYDADEALLQLSKKARQGETIDAGAVKTAMTNPKSVYARALAVGVKNLIVANGLLRA